MLKLTIKDRIRSWMGVKLFNIIGIKSGPEMIRVCGDWYFIDFYGNLFKLHYTGDPDNPLIITVKKRR